MTFNDSKQTILIVEDDDIIAELIVQIVDELGYQTVLKKTGHSAIAWLKDHRTDLMILDYSLPDMNAAILTSLLSHDKSIPPFIVSTGMGDELIAVDMMKRGARDYLVKNSQFLTNLPLVVNRIMRELSTENQLHSTQAELSESKEILRLIIDTIPDIICYKDYLNGWQMANQFSLDLFDLSESDYIGKSNADLQIICPKHKKIFADLESEEIEIYKQHKNIRAYEIIPDKNNQNLTFDFIKIPMYDQYNQPKGLLFVGREITEILNSLEEKKNIEAKALKAQKLESLGVLAGGVAHDFNNLLTVILGYTDLALHMINPGQPVFNNLKEIENSSKRAAELCKQMLAYSGRGKFFVQPINLNLMLKGLNSLINSSVTKKITVDYQLSKDLKLIEADTNQIQQLVMNLILNANEAIGDVNGKITIQTSNVTCTEAFLTNYEYSSDLLNKECICLRITDNGSGISKDIQEKIFEPFFTTRGTGRGLGLPAVLGIVKSHYGTIRIESDIQKGTDVIILLPAIIDKKKTEGETISLITEFHFNKKVLIIDDETSILNMTKELLEHLGFSVIACESSLKAINIYNQDHNNILFTIIDMSMPDLDGLELFLSFKNINPDNKSIITSGYHENKAMDKFKDFDDYLFLQKPFNLYELTLKINDFIRHFNIN